MKDYYVFMDQSNNDGKDETEFNDMPEGIIEDKYHKLFMLS